MNRDNYKITFFGSDIFSTTVLDELNASGFSPSLVVTTPDRKVGRGLVLTPPPAKNWAQERNIEVVQFEKLDDEAFARLTQDNWDLFIVASYGKIVPERFLNIPKFKTLNVHPSMLPLYRGASPIETQIVNGEKNIGVTIILLDKEMDHGPIITQEKWIADENQISNVTCPELTIALAKLGGEILAKSISDYCEQKLIPVEQEHKKASYTKKIIKEDGLINPNDGDELNYRKYRAYIGWPKTYFFIEHKDKVVRVIITEAVFHNGQFRPAKIIPEGGREMSYQDFLRGA